MIRLKQIWQIYKYTYYWLYTWQKKLFGKQDVPEFSAVTIMSLSFICNIGSLAVLIDLILDVQLIPLGLPKKDIILPLVVVLGGHYFMFMFMFNGKYKTIEEEFISESKEERKYKGKWVLLYDFGSILLFIFLIIFGAWLKSFFKSLIQKKHEKFTILNILIGCFSPFSFKRPFVNL
ncbi:hypothetical protein FRY74_05495 [Vicingus serpentipes]|uniref:Uncharacterized protein n=1 Tax=Vicingus serpentipes TaxID=1926625 RepID=A0A5C6RVF2_9FLAO|nr:hypothetical protein [Vicingus serpentipes]TXB66024.1 hypothetical protein FRY74_05495 [Vicingus serpentipes]